VRVWNICHPREVLELDHQVEVCVGVRVWKH